MPGFVDVSNMTSEEVRRMGHADDCDDVDFQPRRKPKSYVPTRPASAKYIVSDVWAATCAAHRVNGGYYKESKPNLDPENPGRVTSVQLRNRDVMMQFLADPTQLTVDDIERGEHCRKYLESDLTFRTLKGKTGEFDAAIRKVLAVQGAFDDHFHKYELAIVACLPQSVKRSEIRQNSDSRVQFATGGFVGKVDDKVELNVEVLSSNFSQQYGIYWIRAITEADQAVFFSNKESFDPGTHLTIKGTVKAHKDNLTQLNRVKVL
jgi:hypothetical protein